MITKIFGRCGDMLASLLLALSKWDIADGVLATDNSAVMTFNKVEER